MISPSNTRSVRDVKPIEEYPNQALIERLLEITFGERDASKIEKEKLYVFVQKVLPRLYFSLQNEEN